MTSIKHLVESEEWQLRTDLSAFFRLMAGYGWDDLLLAHMSTRLSD